MNSRYELIDKNPYDGKDFLVPGKGMIIKEKWSEKYINLIIDYDIKHLFLNTSFNWECNTYGFLKEMPLLTSLDIIDSNSNRMECIEYQNKLIELSLNVRPRNKIEFSKLYSLEKCLLNWSIHTNSIFEVATLKNLYIDEMKTRDKHSLHNLGKLVELTIGNSNITNLSFIKSMKNSLKSLELLNCKSLTDLSAISELNFLTSLNIDGTKKIDSLDFLENLENLEILLLDVDKIESISSIAKLKKLKALGIYGHSANIKNGNLSDLTLLPNLSMLAITDKKHYSHKVIKQWDWNDFGKPSQLLELK